VYSAGVRGVQEMRPHGASRLVRLRAFLLVLYYDGIILVYIIDIYDDSVLVYLPTLKLEIKV